MNKKLITIATLLAVLALIFGAIGTHTLKNLLSSENLSSFETGVRYQFYHAIVLLIIALNTDKLKNTKWVSNLIIIGVFLFSFSIYLLSLQDILNVNLSFLGPVTPIGGFLLILAWILFLIKP